MKLTKREKLAIQRLLGAGQIISNILFNLSQSLKGDDAKLCKNYQNWDRTYADAKSAIRKLQLPPF